MPKELDRCVQELKRQGYSESEAWAICQARVGSKALKVAEEPKEEENIDTFQNLRKWFSQELPW